MKRGLILLLVALAACGGGTDNGVPAAGVNPCPPKPADETRTQTCTSPATGTWTQTRTYTAAPAPTCWTAGAWTPTTAPAGACVTPPTGTAALTWDPVVVPAGAPALTGYRIYYGTAPRTYAQALGTGIPVTGTSHTVTGLSSGRTYYFAVTATDASGRESGYSNEASKTFP